MEAPQEISAEELKMGTLLCEYICRSDRLVGGVELDLNNNKHS